MKPAILGAVALVIGLGAGTGAKVMTTHPAPAVADSTKADSTKADSLGGYRVCRTPAGVTVQERAYVGQYSSGTIDLSIPETGIVVRDLRVDVSAPGSSEGDAASPLAGPQATSAAPTWFAAQTRPWRRCARRARFGGLLFAGAAPPLRPMLVS